MFVCNDDDDYDKKKNEDGDVWKDENLVVGVFDLYDISNVGFFVFFVLIGVVFVFIMIWFFFWVKNGGFYFKENDWEDYKMIVLWCKGLNGIIFFNVMLFINFGGGSVYKDIDDDGIMVIMESIVLSGIIVGVSDIGVCEK